MSSSSWGDPSVGQKAAYRFHRAFVGFLSRMRPVEYGPHTVQCNAYTRPCALADFPPQATNKASMSRQAIAAWIGLANTASRVAWCFRLSFISITFQYHFKAALLPSIFSASDWRGNRQLHAPAVLT